MRFLGVLIICTLMSFFSLQAQELDCSVRVEAIKAQNIDPKVFKTLENSVYQFMNNRKWTNDKFEPFEKIKCAIIINITESPTEGDYKASFIIQSQRPVFNSSYQSPVFSQNDKECDFEYFEFQQLDYIANGYTNNLTSLLAFYAYVIIGYDYATFQANGGEPYFKLAKSVIDAIPQSARSKYKGWSAFDGSNNRYQLVDAILNPRFKVFNQVIYTYHYSGMDRMYNDVTTARQAVLSSIKDLEKFNEDSPNNILLRTFFIAKSDELFNLLKGATPMEKGSMVDVLSKLDPLNSEKYRGLLKF
ncbi:MAG: DUF4835 family protein [Chitinophagales bacterium]|nr:DUF4835 family protein [Chitinophagales bacterium]